MSDVTGTIWTKSGFNIYSQSFSKSIINIDQILTPAIGNIKCLSCCRRRCKASFQICLNHIFNIGKVSALPSISINGRSLSIQKLFDKLWYDCSICAIRILTPSKYIKIPQSISVKPIVHSILLSPFFICAFGYCIRG